jgi:hypothetical protein
MLDRKKLINEYDNILLKSGLNKNHVVSDNEEPLVSVVLQSTSGTQGLPLLIPRSKKDIEDIAVRALKYYTSYFGCMPRKVAMIGGISHINAAETLEMNGLVIRHFKLDTLDEVISWRPEIITCYPSILRVLLEKYKSELSFIKAIKVGGEKLFPADCKKLFDYFPELLVIEQYGLTELPALALRAININTFQYEDSHITVPFDIQTKRFSLLNEYEEGWYPIIAKDNFPELLFQLDSYYETGDEALWSSSRIIDFRRQSVPENRYLNDMNQLLEKGFSNVQLDLEKNIIFYEEKDPADIDPVYFIDKLNFIPQKTHLIRLKNSNKLPLIYSHEHLPA